MRVLPFAGGVCDQPDVWIDKLARWLPFVIDQETLRQEALRQGRRKPSPDPRDEEVIAPEQKAGRLHAALDSLAAFAKSTRPRR